MRPPRRPGQAPFAPEGFNERIASKMAIGDASMDAVKAWSRNELSEFHLPLDAQREMLRVLCEVAGKVSVSNGTQQTFRRTLPTDSGLTEDQAWAAYLLQLGDIESLVEAKSAVDGDYPASGGTTWKTLRQELVPLLDKLANLPNPTKGEESLSRRSYAQRALQHFQEFELHLGWLLGGISDPSDRAAFEEAMRQAAVSVAMAGWFAQAAFAKEIEVDAERGHKVHEGGKKGHAERHGSLEEKQARWREMVLVDAQLYVETESRKNAEAKAAAAFRVSTRTIRRARAYVAKNSLKS